MSLSFFSAGEIKGLLLIDGSPTEQLDLRLFPPD